MDLDDDFYLKYFTKRAKTWSRGKNNSQYGTMWICNLELKENKKISKEEEIPDGWIKGRNKWKPKPKSNRKKLKNPFYITDGKSDRKINFENQEIPVGWYKGRSFKLSKTSRKKISNSAKVTNKNRVGMKYNKARSSSG